MTFKPDTVGAHGRAPLHLVRSGLLPVWATLTA